MTATLGEAIPEYLSSQQSRGKKPGTLRNERTVLNQFLAITGNLLVKNVTGIHIDRYLSSRPDLAPGTWNRNLGYMKVFFKWCRGRKYVSRDFDPMEGVGRRAVPPRDFIFLPADRFGELLDAAPNGRDRAVIAIGLYTFQRASELNRLTWDDIEDTHHDPKQWRVAVYRQKTEERDYLPLALELRDELARWKLEYGRIVGEIPRGHWYVVPAYHWGEWRQDPHGRLVREGDPKLNPTQRHMKPQRSVQAALERLGYQDRKHEGAHTLRRSGGLALYRELAWNRGHDGALRIVQSMFGHKSLATTERYLRLSLEDKRRNDLIAGQVLFPDRQGKVVELAQGSQGRAAV